jgi:hypothetical protein
VAFKSRFNLAYAASRKSEKALYLGLPAGGRSILSIMRQGNQAFVDWRRATAKQLIELAEEIDVF